MVQLQIVSDLHLEFIKNPIRRISEYLHVSAPYLLLLGDICPLNDKILRDWMLRVCPKYRKVIYVLGNHEFYDTKPSLNMTQSINKFRKWASRNTPNLCLLDNESIDLEGYRIIGGTMWTHVDNLNRHIIENNMNCYRNIITDCGRFSVDMSNNLHAKFCSFLRQELSKAKNRKVIVLTHYAPLMDPRMQREEHRSDDCRQAYMVNMSDYMQKNIIMWAFGHTHCATDFVYQAPLFQNTIRIYSNPKGYEDSSGKCEETGYNKNNVVTI